MRRLFYLLFFCVWFFCSCKNGEQKARKNPNSETKSSSKKRILFVVSNAHFYGDSKLEATNHFPEIILAHEEFKNSGFEVDFVSPYGGSIAIGYIYSSDSLTKKYLYDSEFMDKLQNTKPPNEIDPNEYAAIFYSGGGSAMFTVPGNKDIQEIALSVYERNGIVSAVCHGTAGIADLKDKSGKFIVSNKKITGFPDLFEDKDAEYYKEFPFSIQERINQNGGNFSFSSKGWDDFLVKDGRVITGQDPTGSAVVAKSVIETLNHKD